MPCHVCRLDRVAHMATGKMRCARCDYCGCTRKRLTLPYTQKTETSASGSARTTGSWAWRGRLTWKLSSGIADRRPARRLAAQTALEETIVVLVRYYNPLRDDDKPWHWRPALLSRTRSLSMTDNGSLTLTAAAALQGRQPPTLTQLLLRAGWKVVERGASPAVRGRWAATLAPRKHSSLAGGA